MTLYDTIFKRKSTRKYNMTPLESTQIDEIKSFSDNLIPLFPNISTSYLIVDSVKNILPVKSPHYMLIQSEICDNYLENIGFMFQQLDLFLQSKNLGSCWLGLAKPNQKLDTTKTFVIAISFGIALDSPHRNISEFNRKNISEISNSSDYRIEAARLAPSATNSQHWFFECENNSINCYQKKLNPALTLMYDKMNKIDMGISICHIYYATKHNNKEFLFSKHNPPKILEGYIYTGTVF